jgi:hypothetical protein
MFNKSMVASASSPLLLESFIASNQYEFFIPFSFVAINTLLGQKISTIAKGFNGQSCKP